MSRPLILDVRENGEKVAVQARGVPDVLLLVDNYTPLRTLLSQQTLNYTDYRFVTFRGHLPSLLIKHPTKFGKFLKEIAAWSAMKGLNIEVPHRLPTTCIRGFLQALRTFILHPERNSSFADLQLSGDIHMGNLGVEIGTHYEYPPWILNRNFKMADVHDRICHLILECTSPTRIEILNPVSASLFEKICSVSSMRKFEIWDPGDDCIGTAEIATLTKALTKPIYSLRKRKRTSTGGLGSLCQLEELKLWDVDMDRSNFGAICQLLLENISTVPTLGIVLDYVPRPDIDTNWDPMLNILRRNNTVQVFKYHFITSFNSGDHGKAEYSEYLESQLHSILRDNTTIHSVDLNTKTGHTQRIQMQLDLNYFGLSSLIVSSQANPPAKTAIVDAIIAALDKNSTFTNSNGIMIPRDRFTCIYYLFREHPQFISLLL